MNQEHEIFAKDYAALQEKLACYPGITIVAVEKDPPETYVIEYRLFGYGYDADGGIQMQRRHRVEIKLPFGYPHFPPTVRPLTRICHPDMAEHAIRIADYWQTTPSLADLVIHVADMIRGAEYTSSEGVFNEQAAQWYAENSGKLPLAELEYHDPKARAAQPRRQSAVSYKLVAGILLAVLVATAGALVVRDRRILFLADTNLEEMKSSVLQRKFSEARAVGRKTADDLAGVLLFPAEKLTRQAEVVGILESPTMREGLAGRVEHQGRYVDIRVADTLQEVGRLQEAAVGKLSDGDVEAAMTIFAAAARLAEKNELAEAADEVRRLSAERRLAYYLDKANGSYSRQEWAAAVELYGLAIMIAENEGKFLTAASLDNLEKLITLKTLALASMYRAEAVQAEKEKRYAAAVERYLGIVALIQRSGYSTDPVLAKVGSEAAAERLRVHELALVAESTEYLLRNFKELFIEQYPGLYEPGLQSPRVRYIGRNNGKLVFIISCIELVQRTSNEFRLYYQYDPERRNWDIYREEK